jgi:chloramphenicol-sensitive protein RarD
MPLYWKALAGVPAAEILSHRVIWALAFNVILLSVLRRWSWVRSVIKDGKLLLLLAASSTLLSINWLVYIWAVNSGHVVETSLGYFINPLVNVALGVIFFKERLRTGQWLAIASAAAGVIFLTVQNGSLPWIALTLAASFGAYGALRKVARLDSLEGLTMETALIAPFAAAFLLFTGVSGTSTSVTQSALLLGAGAVTAIPLLLFSVGVRSIPMTTLGLLQYIAPTLQFIIGALIYHEPFDATRAIGFGAVWLALAVYTIEGLAMRRKGSAQN